MTDTILGLLGFLLGLAAFAAGYALSLAGGKRPKSPAKTDPAGEKRAAAEAEERAFRALTGYSADVAYGLAEFPGEGEF